MQGVSLQLAVANRPYRAHFSFLSYHRKHTPPIWAPKTISYRSLTNLSKENFMEATLLSSLINRQKNRKTLRSLLLKYIHIKQWLKTTIKNPMQIYIITDGLETTKKSFCANSRNKNPANFIL